VKDFVAAWSKVMNLDRFDLAWAGRKIGQGPGSGLAARWKRQSRWRQTRRSLPEVGEPPTQAADKNRASAQALPSLARAPLLEQSLW